jgi:hypothetical protein
MSQSIEERFERLERRQTWLLTGVALTGLLALWLVFKTTLNPGVESPSALRTKRLDIVDSAGVASQTWRPTTRRNTRWETSTLKKSGERHSVEQCEGR